jgi:hypothetical protein
MFGVKGAGLMRIRHKASCPFCWEWLPPARRYRRVFSGEGCSGGRCSCGAWFVLDVTGHGGGEALMDVRALACDGDLDRAISLCDGIDVEVKTQPLLSLAVQARPRLRKGADQSPKVWALRLKAAPEAHARSRK